MASEPESNSDLRIIGMVPAMPREPFVRVQAWIKAEDGSDVRIDFRGRLHDMEDRITFANRLRSYAELEALPFGAYQKDPPVIEVRASQTGWKFRRGKPEGY